jgi:acetoin utilization protein AcuB
MSIKNVMTGKVVTVKMDDPLSAVKEIFEAQRFHHVLVVENGKLFGVVSDRDLLKALSPRLGTLAETDKDAATLNKRVHQIMTRKPVTLHPEATLLDAVRVFKVHRISCIPLVDEEGRPVGILSWRDLLMAMAEQLHPT